MQPTARVAGERFANRCCASRVGCRTQTRAPSTRVAHQRRSLHKEVGIGQRIASAVAVVEANARVRLPAVDGDAGAAARMVLRILTQNNGKRVGHARQ